MSIGITRHRLVLPAALALSLVASPAASADEQMVMAPGAQWQYTFTAPGAGWQTGAAAGVTWQLGDAPFSNCGTPEGSDCGSVWDPDHLFFPGTVWPADNSGNLGDDLWVRRQVDLSGLDLSSDSLHWALGADNGYTLYINGTQLSHDNAEFFTYRWEYQGTVPTSVLQPGLNWIAVALEDHGGLNAFDMQLTLGPDTPPPPVPAPETLALMLAALGLGLIARRRGR